MLALTRVNGLSLFQRRLFAMSSAIVKDTFVVIETRSLIKEQNEVLRYPIVWLRDNCQCNKCFHKESLSRVLDWSAFDVNLKPIEVEVRLDR